MILSTLENSARIESLHPLFKIAFNYIKTQDLLNTDLGRIELDGDNLFINNSEVDGLRKEDQILEVHQKYIDIHVLLSGEETVGWLPTSELQTLKTSYQDDKDYAFYSDKPATYVTMRPGDFLIVYPEDAHAPIISSGKIRKAIVKVKL
ncbi:Conserved hypothetical protein CHP00022 [Bacteroides coprosuis DSM 18011]|uniref:YhcH/YjgK/YiaL family protein n=1 Tax=Bacteroides coprosuis DSM 18011 TaxID=679937 RepID=F3ZTE6_9BACE|nr:MULTISPECIES: YhcH/YjgK/YiaL family protein [Bacteroides]EGJ71036.1 Conserved hypothetical protein CHP00022 [Bacteroides coprosuis DSM 18011]HJD92722.1 YhcH/YjgK/YiaL family protein [Bacteroides coprosuis]